MTLRLYRIFNLLRREFWKSYTVLGIVFFVIPLLALILLDAFHFLYVAIILGLNLIGFFSMLAGYPSRATYRDGVLTYTENYEITKGERRCLHFRITEIRQVELVQNSLEKRLNVGRIRFRGTAEVEPASALKEHKLVFFQLCGVSNFDKVSKMFENK